ncbi:membrane transport protein-domain-containing protein [Armillaria nabsnona]|nr:membrane transport protein-domain-containing protein [Armillaria nabsnona]
MPLLKMFLTIFFGFWLTRKGFFTAAASRGVSPVIMHVALPGLLFSNIVPPFNPQNVSAMGPLFLVAFVYMVSGLLFGALIREFCYVPRNFWAGILVATALSNWGNLPTAVVLTVTEQKPFNPDTDPQHMAFTIFVGVGSDFLYLVGVSYVSVFILACNIVMCVPQGDEANVHVGWREKPIAAFFLRLRSKLNARPKNPNCEMADDEKDLGKEKVHSVVMGKQPESDLGEMETNPEIQLARRASNPPRPRRPSAAPNASQSFIKELPDAIVQSIKSPSAKDQQEPELPEEVEEKPSRFASLFPPFLRRTFKPLSSLFTPITISMYIPIPISLVPQLKALFVEVDGGAYYHGPDGNPPLTFIINIGKFYRRALPILMAAFVYSRVCREHQCSNGSGSIGCFVCAHEDHASIQENAALAHHGVIPKDALVERFVAILLSGTPSAVNQLIITQLYAKDHDLDTLSAFLLLQYIFMFISTAAITAIALSLL